MSNLSTHSAVRLDFTKPLCIVLFIHLRRHQYEQQMQIVPPFVKLYEVIFNLFSTHNTDKHNSMTFRTLSI
jgi:hypothetical protein